ncbi:MAG: MFS transporter, partial [bacterium]
MHSTTENTSLRPSRRNPWLWVPSLYYAEGIPYVVVMTVSVVMYKKLGLSNTDIALYTSWLYLPWVIKPLWSPFVDVLKTKRYWIVFTQLAIGAGLAGVALTIPAGNFFTYTLAFLWLLAFSSATHDIAADGFYMLGLSKHDQAFFVGIRSTFYRLAMITGQGVLIMLAGFIESQSGLPSVDVTVKARPKVETISMFQPDSLVFDRRGGDEIRILKHPPQLVISTAKRTKAEVDSMLALAKKQNVQNGFYPTEQKKQEESKTDHLPSWWQSNILQPLESFLKKYFAPTEKTDQLEEGVGNIGVLYFTLSGKPEQGEEIAVNFGRATGDQSINLVEGSRFVFTAENWNKA